MQADELLNAFGYTGSGNFLPSNRFAEAIEHVHVLRRTVYACRVHDGTFHGVYSLREDQRGASTPVVFFAEAPTSAAADEIHRKVWNQNVVPFLLVRLSNGVRLYSGFRYERGGRKSKANTGVLEVLIAFEDVLARLAEFRAAAIDAGRLWEVRGKDVDPTRRVDWRLLGNLEHLGSWLRANGLAREAAHALIGKFVYLRYLVDRDILSKRRLEEFEVESDEVFGRKATLRGVRTLIERVDEWLNGSVFPLSLSGKNAPTSDQLREVAGVFLGDDPASGQLHLDFAAYDFSYIPIETLSVIYEQFLHAEERGRAVGAYYTPIPLVNFMLAELDDHRPIDPRMRVFDPSCGSGAFLVQCYRRLIERRVCEVKRLLRPTELRELLIGCIFGLDRDADACRVTELSLVLTMLDYIEPPDLHRTPSFKLPNLHNSNIFEGDFFEDGAWREVAGDGFDWVVGNPPWLQLDPDELDEVSRPALAWIQRNAETCPIAGLEVAEAFAWKAAAHANKQGVITLLLPAMSLFKEQDDFRDKFFVSQRVFAVANFANLREVLFAGRARMPAAALFYSPAKSDDDTNNDTTNVLVYSPLIANQEANRPREEGTRLHTWTILVNRSEIRSLSLRDIVGKGGIPWKIAMWGTVRDKRLLDSLEKRISSLGTLAESQGIIISQGLELREQGSGESVEATPDLVGKRALSTEALRRLGRVHTFPQWTIESIPKSRAFIRRRGGIERPLSVCRPPHVVVSAARNWAVFSDEFLVVPPRQIGIAGSKQQSNLLRALALYFNSDFVAYHQFFDSTQEGIRDGRSTLASLRRMPTPFTDMSSSELRRWADLHKELVAASPSAQLSDPETFSLELREPNRALVQLEGELNKLVSEALELTASEQWLVEDLVHVRKTLTDGRLGDEAIRRPKSAELNTYAATLKHELDTFLDPALNLAHRVNVMHASTSGIVHIELKRGRATAATVQAADDTVTAQLRTAERAITDAHEQWLYFDRNLFLYRNEAAYVLKPMQRLWWTRSQALADADELIAESLASQESA
jgi:hypothetical protein